MVELELQSVILDPVSKSPVVILKKKDSDEVLPIWIGNFEAQGIAMKLENYEPPRPMTYDLLKNILTTLGAFVERIVINDLKEGTYYAQIHLILGNNRYVIDSRPSDAINLAIRTNAPIFAEDKVFEESSIPMGGEREEREERKEDEEMKKLKEWLENLRPEDFEKGESS